MSTATKTLELPHWDMTPVFPSLESDEFNKAWDSISQRVTELSELFEQHGIRLRDDIELDDSLIEVFEKVVNNYNTLYEDIRELYSYIGAFITTDSRNDLAQAKSSEFDAKAVELQNLETRLTGWIASLGAEALIDRSTVAKEHSFAVRKAAESAEHQMSEPEESLFATLQVTGGSAWGRLHGNVTSRLMVDVDLPDGTQRLPMSKVRGLAHDSDGEVRRAAYDAELKGWESVAVPLAAAINSIKGERNVVSKQRGWKDSLEPELFTNNIDRPTLEAMQQAVTESFPDFRRYLKAKAKLLGKDSLPWWDLFAPVGGEEHSWDWSSATDFVVRQFGAYSDRLAGLAQRAFDENWVDAEPREGKRDGAFCAPIRGDVSRVLMNFAGSFSSVSTLAHELGHAYHNINLADRTPLQRQTPMALSETASIFCETLIVQAALGDATEAEKLAILEADIQDTCQVVVDIHSRYLFETGVFDGRSQRELSIDELNELMLEGQRQTYGDGLDDQSLHPYMWEMKPHYYHSNYYNWPYTFGLLFGVGLYAQYREDPGSFPARYDELLSSTGLESAADLGKRFGIDFASVDFWRSSLAVIRGRIEEFEALVNG